MQNRRAECVETVEGTDGNSTEVFLDLEEKVMVIVIVSTVSSERQRVKKGEVSALVPPNH